MGPGAFTVYDHRQPDRVPPSLHHHFAAVVGDTPFAVSSCCNQCPVLCTVAGVTARPCTFQKQAPGEASVHPQQHYPSALCAAQTEECALSILQTMQLLVAGQRRYYLLTDVRLQAGTWRDVDMRCAPCIAGNTQGVATGQCKRGWVAGHMPKVDALAAAWAAAAQMQPI